jgi:hypothetical protein
MKPSDEEAVQLLACVMACILGDMVLDATSSQLALDDQQVADEFVQARLDPRADQAASGESPQTTVFFEIRVAQLDRLFAQAVGRFRFLRLHAGAMRHD